MTAIFPSSRPNIGVRVIPKIPATMTGVGGIGISKENGVWTIEPAWDDLQLIAPGILLDPTSKELWVRDPLTDTYYRMTLAGLGQAIFWGTSDTPTLIAAGPKTMVTQTGKDWLPGMFVQAFSRLAPTNFMIGQVTAYSGGSLTFNVLAVGGAGTFSDWTIVQSTLPGSGPPGATGAAGGLGYNFVAATSGDPTTGQIGFNNVSIPAITEIRISHLDRMGVNILQEIMTWDDSTTAWARARIKVSSSSNPNKFVIATITGPVVNGAAHSTFPVASPSGATLPDVGNCQVEVYRTGDVGGPGADGSGSGARYVWSTLLTATDPTFGTVKVNNAAPQLATEIYMHHMTASGQDVAPIIATWDDSTLSLNRGTITFLSITNPLNFLVMQVRGGITNNGSWSTIPVTNVAGFGNYVAGEAFQVTFSRSGDVGVGGFYVSDTPPVAPSQGQAWFESDTAKVYVWYDDGSSGQWVEVGSTTGAGGAGGTATDIIFTPVGDIAANNVQAALAELSSEKVKKSGDSMTGFLTLHSAPALDLHAATKLYVDTAVVGGGGGGGTALGTTFTPAGNIAATNVQAALVEVDAEKVKKSGDTMTGGLMLDSEGWIGFGGTTGDVGFWSYAGAAGGAAIRWGIQLGTDPAYSTFNIQAFDDAGVGVTTPISINRTNGRVTLLGAPTAPLHAATKDYVDTRPITDTTKVLKAGDTMSGHLFLPTGPAAANAVRKDYVDAADTALGTVADGKVAKTGGVNAVMSGDLTVTRSGAAAPTTGTILFGNAGNKTLSFDGTTFSFVGGPLAAPSLALTGALSASGAATFTGTTFMGNNATVQNSASPTTGNLYFGNSGGKYIYLDATYFQFIGVAAIIAPEGYKPGGGAWLASSDARIKNIVKDYGYGLAAVVALHPVVYTYKGNDTSQPPVTRETAPFDESMHHDTALSGREFAGLIAQEVEVVIPEMVTKRSGFIDGEAVTDMRDLDTGPLIFALINAVKELKAEIDLLKSAAPAARKR